MPPRAGLASPRGGIDGGILASPEPCSASAPEVFEHFRLPKEARDVRTRSGRYAALLAIVVLGTLIAGSGVASAKGKGKGRHPLRIAATQIQSDFLDLGAPGPSLGDELVFSERLFRHHREVGESGVVCTVTGATPPYDVLTYHCVGTLKLRSGQITLQGLIEVQGMDDPGPFVVAITGGTGRFNDAGGTAVVREVGDTRAVYKLFFSSGKKSHHHARH